MYLSMMILLHTTISSFAIKVSFGFLGIIEGILQVQFMFRRRKGGDYFIFSYCYSAVYLLVMAAQIRKKKYISASGCLLILIGSFIYLLLDNLCTFKEDECFG